MQRPGKIRCLIIDDEPLAREILKQHISGVEALTLVGTCSNALEAIAILQTDPVDLLFLDIQMPQLLGTTLMRTLSKAPKVIFTTAYRKYAVEGFELNAVDYILKPISFERFLKAVNKVLQSNLPLQNVSGPSLVALSKTDNTTQNENSFLYFRVEKKMVKVLYRDILFIEALKDYIKIITASRTMVTRYVLTSLEEILPSGDFLRIHKSYIVAIQKIDSYNAEFVQIARHEIPIGRLYKYEVIRILNLTSASS